MSRIFSIAAAAAALSLVAACGAYRAGGWPRLNYEDPGPPALDGATSAAKANLPPPPPGAVRPTPPLAELTADFDRLSNDSEAQLSRLDEGRAGLDSGDQDARRRAWLALQLELSRLNRLRGELTGLISDGDELAGRNTGMSDELQLLLRRMRQMSDRLATAAQEAERHLKATNSS